MPNDLDVPPATTAVLHGMMATLSEVLGGIDSRMAGLEQQLRDVRAQSGSPRALAQTVEAAVARLAERVEALEAIVVQPPARDDALHAAVDALRQSVDALAVRPVRDDALHAAVAEVAARPPAVDVELRAAVADLRAAVADLAARPPAVDTELRSAVAELAARPVLDAELRAAVAELASRPPAVDEELRAAVADLAARPTVDSELRAAVAELAARPPAVDAELRAAVADLASRPPAVDEELRAAVADLAARPAHDPELRSAVAELRAAVADLAARPPAVDAELRAAIADLASRPPFDPELRAAVADLAARPAFDQELRAAVGQLAHRPVRDDELHAAVNRLAETLAKPADPDDPVRLGITSLHERLGVLLELASQPPKPDDAVRAAIAALQQQIASLKDPSPDPALNELAERLNAVTDALANHPAATLNETMARVEQQVAAFVAQPGPGPAVAMVAAGLAERFESRTDALVDLLTSTSNRMDALATAPTELAERLQQFVAQHMAELRGEDVIERIRTVVEGQQGDVVAMRDAMRSLFDAVERHGAVSGQVAELLLENRASLGREIDRLQEVLAGQNSDLGERVQAALEAAARADAHAAEMGAAVSYRIDQAAAALIADVQAMVATGQDPAQLDAVADRISDSVRKESELLTQRVASLSVAVDNLRATLDGLSEEMANSIGRKATEVGRRLAADLGIKPKKERPKQRSLNP